MEVNRGVKVTPDLKDNMIEDCSCALLIDTDTNAAELARHQVYNKAKKTVKAIKEAKHTALVNSDRSYNIAQ